MTAAAHAISGEIRRAVLLNPACIACGDENPCGLHLHFSTGQEMTSAAWTPAEPWQGFRGVIHGGIVATVLDEAMSKAVVAHGWEALTVELKVRLRAKVVPGEKLRVSGKVVSRQGRQILTEAALLDSLGAERAHAWGKFLVPRHK